MRAKKNFVFVFLILAALLVSACSLIKELKPTTFSLGATELGYKSSLTADELIEMAAEEGYTEREVRQKIKGTSWEKSKKIEPAIKKYYSKVRNLPSTFKEAATSAGYKTDINAEELIQLAKNEGYSQSEVLQAIKGTPWEKSNLVSEAIEKYYSNSTNISSDSKKNVMNFIASGKTSNEFIFTSDDDSAFYDGEKLVVDITKTDSEILCNFKYTDRTNRIIQENQTYKVSGKNVSFTNCDYKYHKTKITSKEDSDTFTNFDYEIIKRYDAALKRHGYLSQNPMYR